MKDLNLSSTQSYVTPAPERYAGKKSKFLSAAVLRTFFFFTLIPEVFNQTFGNRTKSNTNCSIEFSN